MKGNKKLLGSLALVGLALLGVLAIPGTGAAVVDEGNITLDQPDNQVVEVDLNFSASETVNVSVVDDGTTISNTEVSGSSGVVTGTVDLTGLSTGEYGLEIDSNANVTVEDTRMVTQITNAANMSQNDTLSVDVGFDAVETSTANVTFEQPTVSNSSTLSFNPVDYADGSGVKTAEYTAGEDGMVNVTVTTSPASGYESVYVPDGALIGGGVLTTTNTQLVGAVVVVVGLLVARNRDLI